MASQRPWFKSSARCHSALLYWALIVKKTSGFRARVLRLIPKLAKTCVEFSTDLYRLLLKVAARLPDSNNHAETVGNSTLTVVP
jgi:hypothetical protein